jgi:hypothetical protein
LKRFTLDRMVADVEAFLADSAEQPGGV